MAEYAAVRRGKLKLKGNTGSLLGHKKKKTKRKKECDEEEWMKEPGAVRHGIQVHHITRNRSLAAYLR